MGGIYTGHYVVNDTLFLDANNHLSRFDTVYYTFQDTNGCSAVASDTVLNAICLSIEEISLNNQIQIYPNPANTTLFIKVTGVVPEAMKLYNVSGQLIYEGGFAPEIDVSKLSPGVYFIEINAGEEVGRKMFVKM